MILDSRRFGKVDYEKSDIVIMMRGLLGFESSKSYIIIGLKGHEPFKWLISLDDPDLSFLIIDPFFILPDYKVKINPRDLALLGARTSADISIFAIVTFPRGRADRMTADFQGPIAVNKRNLHAVQLVLGESNYSSAHPIFKELEKRLAKGAI